MTGTKTTCLVQLSKYVLVTLRKYNEDTHIKYRGDQGSKCLDAARLRLTGADLSVCGPPCESSSLSSLSLQWLSPPGICSPLQLLCTRSCPQRLHSSHFITITSDSNLLPNWVSNPEPDMQAIRWISSFSLVSMEASGQLTSGLLNVLGASSWGLGCRPVEQQCWVTHCHLSSCLEI